MAAHPDSTSDGGPPVLAVTDDQQLADCLDRLGAAAGVSIDVVPAVARSRWHWSRAPLVLVGSDAVHDGAVDGPRRPGVLLVSRDGDDSSLWERALAIGAEHVAVLPADERWLVDRVAEAGDGPGRAGFVLGVVGGRGGAGASVLAATLARTAVDRGARALLVDADPWGGGIDLVVGGEDVPGLRWRDLAAASGRVRPSVLRTCLPQVRGVPVLSWGRDDVLEVPPEAVAAVLDSAGRSADLVVVDLPRRLDPHARAVLHRCDRVLVVVPAEVRATAAAARAVTALTPWVPDLRVVVRGPSPTGLGARAVAEALGLPLAGQLRAERGLDAALDRGEVPGSRRGSRLAALCHRLVADLVPERAGAA